MRALEVGAWTEDFLSIVTARSHGDPRAIGDPGAKSENEDQRPMTRVIGLLRWLGALHVTGAPLMI